MSEENINPEVAPVEAPAAAPADWKSSVSEDLRGSVESYGSIDDLVKSHNNAQSMIGRSVRIPGEDASAESKQEFYKSLEKVPNVYHVDEENVGKLYDRLGRPESAEGYKYELGELGDLADPTNVGEFNKFAHELGLSNKQAEALIKYDLQRAAQSGEALESSKVEGEKQLKQMWGNDYDARLHGAKEALKHYSEKFPEAAQQLVNSELGNNPVVLAILAEQAKSLKEQAIINPQTSVSYGTSSSEALEKISEIRGNKEHPYNKPFDPAHKQAMQKMNELYAIAYPNS